MGVLQLRHALSIQQLDLPLQLQQGQQIIGLVGLIHTLHQRGFACAGFRVLLPVRVQAAGQLAVDRLDRRLGLLLRSLRLALGLLALALLLMRGPCALRLSLCSLGLRLHIGGHGICIVPVDLRRGVVRNRLRCHFFGWLRFCLLRRCIAGMQLGQCRANYPAGLLRPVFAQLHNHVLQGLAIELAHGLARAAVQPLRQCRLCLPQLLHQRAHLLRIARVHFLRGVLPSLPLGAGSIELLQ